MDTKELRAKRAKLVADARAILDKAEQEKREALTAEEQAEYDRVMKDVEGLKGKIEREERLSAEEDDLKTVVNRAVQDDGDDVDDGVEKRSGGPRATKEYREGFRRWLSGGVKALTGMEIRALQADSDEAGGYVVAPEQFVAELIKGVDNLVAMRGLARVIKVPKAASLGAPSLDADPADPTWVAEIAVGTEDSTMDFGKRELHPHPLAQFIKVSRRLIRQSVLDVEGLVRDRLAYKLAVVEENAFLNGSGANQPLGLFVASANGINTDRDVSTGNAATSITFDGLRSARGTLKGQYRNRPSTRWLFHRDAITQISKLKDGDGRYLWEPDVRVGEPDRVLGIGVIESEYVPNTFQTTLYVGLLGDLSFYWIADALDTEIQRLEELYAATNQVGFISRLETDGMPVLAEAFVRVKLG